MERGHEGKGLGGKIQGGVGEGRNEGKERITGN